jgi:glycosyltransferase involved in cell wall biosynthesis
MSFPTLADAQKDWRALETPDFAVPPDIHLISEMKFTYCPGIEVEYIPPGFFSRLTRHFGMISNVFYALRLFMKCTDECVLVINGGSPSVFFVGMLNRIPLLRKRRILCWGPFVEVNQHWKRVILSFAMKGITLSTLWSPKQVPAHAKFLNRSEDQFIYIPFKANHSKRPTYDIPIGNFVFAGGNGKRDYCCLIEAVRDTGIPVIISATDPNIRKTIESLPNVIVLGAPEPGFAQLQAASRFVVIPMTHTGVKGGGEANFCNAMWHGKPVIAADSIAASEYIIDGETGYVVASGDSEALRQRILELWNSSAKVSLMGKASRQHVEANFTHEKFIRRLLRLALVLGREPLHR